MANGKLIVLTPCRPVTGAGALAAELAAQCDRRRRPALAIIATPGTETDAWVDGCASLPALLFRSTVEARALDGARLCITFAPKDPAFAGFLKTLRNVYERIFLRLPPDFSESMAGLLDGAAYWLCVSDAEFSWPSFEQASREFLSRHHLPLALRRRVITRVRQASSAPSSNDILAHLPYDPSLGISWREAVRRLAERLLQDSSDAPETSAEAILTDLRQRVQPRLVDVMEKTADDNATSAEAIVEAALSEESRLHADRERRQEMLHRVLEDVLGLGPLEVLLKDPEISEIMVNGRGTVFVEKHGRLQSVECRFESDSQLRTLIDRIVAPLGRRVDESMPLCDARLPDGSRVNIVLPPLALDGATITIRKFSERRLGFEELVRLGSLSPAMAEFLRGAVRNRRNILVSGGTGSGKTTLLNALSSAIPDEERIVTLEDAAELRLQKPHVVRLEARPASAEGQGEISIRRLLINALRMRPDRIVVGECRGGEALDMLQAMNTGHDGSLTTLHANAPRDALGRLETLVLMAGLDLPVRVVREQIRSAIHLIVQQARLSDGSRKVTSITEMTGMEGEVLVTQELFRWRNGRFEETGLSPTSRP